MMRRAVAIAILAFLAAGSAAGQSKTGTTVGQFLLIEPSARIASMGNAGVALTDGIQSIYYNPAALGLLDGLSVQVSHSEWLADITYDYAAAAYHVGRLGNVFASVTALNSGEIDVRTVGQPLGTGERYSVRDLAVGLGFGREITDRFSAGLQINYVDETIWHTSLSTMTLNVGTVYSLSRNGIRIGSSISNYGTRARFSGRDLAIQFDADAAEHGDNSTLPAEQSTDRFSVPVLFRVGVSMPRRVSDASRFLFTLDGFHPSDNTESVSAGADWTWKDAVSLRAGYQNLFLEDSEVGLTLGAGFAGGIGSGRFQVDYAWADFGRLEQTHRVTLAMRF